MFGATKSELRRFKDEALKGMRPPKKKKSKDYNFGVSRQDVIRYRKQARA